MKNKELLLLLVLGIFFIFLGFLKEADTTVRNVPKKIPLAQNISPTPSPRSSSRVLGESISQSTGKSVVVASVVDGDTIISTSGEQIRYIGVNAPEKGQPYYDAAKKANEAYVSGKTVWVDSDIDGKDRYGRSLGYIFVGDLLVNKELVRRGVAVSETISPNVKYQDTILAAQQEARANCVGIWSGLCSPSGSLSSSHCIQIISIHANAAGSDTTNKNGEWIALANTCSGWVALDQWLIKDNSASNSYTFKHYVLSPGRKVSIHSGCGTDTQDDLYWKCPEGPYAVWNNDHDHAFLYDNNGRLVSDYQY